MGGGNQLVQILGGQLFHIWQGVPRVLPSFQDIQLFAVVLRDQRPELVQIRRHDHDDVRQGEIFPGILQHFVSLPELQVRVVQPHQQITVFRVLSQRPEKVLQQIMKVDFQIKAVAQLQQGVQGPGA